MQRDNFIHSNIFRSISLAWTLFLETEFYKTSKYVSISAFTSSTFMSGIKIYRIFGNTKNKITN